MSPISSWDVAIKPPKHDALQCVFFASALGWFMLVKYVMFLVHCPHSQSSSEKGDTFLFHLHLLHGLKRSVCYAHSVPQRLNKTTFLISLALYHESHSLKSHMNHKVGGYFSIGSPHIVLSYSRLEALVILLIDKCVFNSLFLYNEVSLKYLLGHTT